MDSLSDKTTVKQTRRYTLSEDASALLEQTPVLIGHLEEMLPRIPYVGSVEVQGWRIHFIFDIEIDLEAASADGETLETVEQRIEGVVANQLADIRRLQKFIAQKGIYPHGHRLVVSDDEYVVTRCEADQSITVHYESDGEIFRVKVDNDDNLQEVIDELFAADEKNPDFVARGTTVIEEWISRHRRGLGSFHGL